MDAHEGKGSTRHSGMRLEHAVVAGAPHMWGPWGLDRAGTHLVQEAVEVRGGVRAGGSAEVVGRPAHLAKDPDQVCPLAQAHLVCGAQVWGVGVRRGGGGEALCH